jgi:hypothetical protein
LLKVAAPWESRQLERCGFGIHQLWFRCSRRIKQLANRDDGKFFLGVWNQFGGLVGRCAHGFTVAGDALGDGVQTAIFE